MPGKSHAHPLWGEDICEIFDGLQIDDTLINLAAEPEQGHAGENGENDDNNADQGENDPPHDPYQVL